MNNHDLQTQILNKQKSKVATWLFRFSWLWHILISCLLIFLILKINDLSEQIHTQKQQIQQLNNKMLDFDDKIINLEKQIQLTLQQKTTLPELIDKDTQESYLQYLTQQLNIIDDFIKNGELSHAKVLLTTLQYQINEQKFDILSSLRAELQTRLQQDIDHIQVLQTQSQPTITYQTQTGLFLANHP